MEGKLRGNNMKDKFYEKLKTFTNPTSYYSRNM